MKKTSISLQGHRTSFSLEPEFLQLLKALAQMRGLSLAQLVGQVDRARLGQNDAPNLSSALRLCVLQALAQQCQGSPSHTPFAQAAASMFSAHDSEPSSPQD